MTLRRYRATDCKFQVPAHQEAGREKVPERLQLLKEGFSGEPPDTHIFVVEQHVVEPNEKNLNAMRLSSEEKSTDLLTIANGSKRPNTRKPTGKHNFHTFHPQIRIVKFVRSQRLSVLRCTRRPNSPPRKLVMLLRRIKEFSVKRTNLDCSIVTQLWCKTFVLIGFKGADENQDCASLQHVRAARSETPFFIQIILWNLFVFKKTWESRQVDPTQIRNRENGRKRSS